MPDMGWKDKIKSARLPEAVVRIAMRGDLVSQYDQLTREIATAKESRVRSLAGSGAAQLEEQLEQLIEEMNESVVEFRLRALPRTRRLADDRPTFADLKKRHPPRTEPGGEIVREDIMGGFVNTLTFPDDLVRHSIIEPQLDEEDWVNLEISQGQFDDLVNAAWTLNQGRVEIPFSRASSRTTSSSVGE